MKDFKYSPLWEQAHQATLALYRITRGIPREELSGVSGFLRRSAMAITTSLAQGLSQENEAELARCCSAAFGSVCEAEYELFLASELGYVSMRECTSLTQRLTELKRALAQRLEGDAER